MNTTIHQQKPQVARIGRTKGNGIHAASPNAVNVDPLEIQKNDVGCTVYSQGNVLVTSMKLRTTVRRPGHREANRQQEIALKVAKGYQAAEKARRAQKHNKSLSRIEEAVIPGRDQTVTQGDWSAESGAATEDSNETSEDKGPFRVKEKVQEFAYELDLPDQSGYRFFPVVHVSRLKAVDEFNDLPNTRLTAVVTKSSRLDFDEELLPEVSREPDHVANEYEMEAILDDRVPLSTSTEQAVREFKEKWMGYEEPAWGSASNLSCGGLLRLPLRKNVGTEGCKWFNSRTKIRHKNGNERFVRPVQPTVIDEKKLLYPIYMFTYLCDRKATYRANYLEVDETNPWK
ncbi:hypothetical protein PHMEG_00024181 [Phytophthora megakarya]|uniref:Tf2-1-like SH3-like domain-containing protein n=1 Tax=Phytophthora megakarya TaxID=4795 RepID=A0A225VGB4_9STRA|nr:hypothetical protein PHMEG_00024181 [Phytophthora megakarya]